MYTRQVIFIVCLCLSFAACALPENGPVKAVYYSWKGIDWTDPRTGVNSAIDDGYNLIIITFYAADNANHDMASAWAGITAQLPAVMEYAHSKGVSIIGSVKVTSSYGTPYTGNATAFGVKVGEWANGLYFDGIEFLFQDIGEGFIYTGLNSTQLADWIVELLTAASETSNGDIVMISAAPSYFGPIGATKSYTGPTGGLSGVYQRLSETIDLVGLFSFNLNSGCGQTYQTIFVEDPCTTNGSISSIANSVPLSKLVLVKPIASTDNTGGGFLLADALATIVRTANTSLGWNTGVAGWVWSGSSIGMGQWINTIYPGSNNVSVTTTGASTTTAATTTTGASTSGATTTAGSTTTSTAAATTSTATTATTATSSTGATTSRPATTTSGSSTGNFTTTRTASSSTTTTSAAASIIYNVVLLVLLCALAILL